MSKDALSFAVAHRMANQDGRNAQAEVAVSDAQTIMKSPWPALAPQQRATPENQTGAALLGALRLQDIPPFSALQPEALAAIRSHLRLVEFAPGAALVREGVRGANRIHIILSGEASVCKSGRDPIARHPLDYEIAVRGPGELAGSVSVLDNRPASATVVARTPLCAAVLDLDALPGGALSRKVSNALVTELGRHMAGRLRHSIDQRVDYLRQEAELAGYRNAIGLVLVTALSMLSLYTLALGIIQRWSAGYELRFVLTPLIIILFAAAFSAVIRLNRMPLAFYGLRLDNLRAALTFSLKASFVFLAVVLGLKALLIVTIPALYHVPLISPMALTLDGQTPISWQGYAAIVTLYILLVPAQEFVARSGVQASLYAFLEGSELKRHIWAILVSNFAFAAVHVHTNPAFALASFIPGIFWGWVFARTNSLAAASVSHVLVGGSGIFLLGIDDIVILLF